MRSAGRESHRGDGRERNHEGGLEPWFGAAGAAVAHTSAEAADSVRAALAGRERPCSQAAERAAMEAVRRLLAEGVPLPEITVERVARIAGVDKAEIHRRWNGKEELFVEVLRSFEPAGPQLPGTSARDDLVALVEYLRLGGVSSRSTAKMYDVFAQMRSYPKLWHSYLAIVVEPRRRMVLDVLRRGVESGELRSGLDIDLVGDMVVGPIIQRIVIRQDASLYEGLAEEMVDVALRGLLP